MATDIFFFIPFSIPLKLTGDNFLLWKTQLLPLLKAYGLARFIDEDPPEISAADEEAWRRSDQQVLSLIVSSLSEPMLTIVVGKETAKEAWEALRQDHSSRIRHKLHTMRKGSSSLEDFLRDVRATSDELAAAGEAVEESLVVYSLLRGLGPEYAAFSSTMVSRLGDLSLEETVALVRWHESTRKSWPEGASQERGQRGCDARCQVCGMLGHGAFYCAQRFNRNYGRWISNRQTPDEEGQTEVDPALCLEFDHWW